MLDYESMKIHYRLIALDLGKQKELDGDPEGIQEIKLVEKLKNRNNRIAENQSMFA